MKIDKRILGVCDVASKEGVRPALASVRIEKNKAIATDGYSLMVIQLPEVENNELPLMAGESYTQVETATIPAKELSAFASRIKKNKHLPVLNLGWSVHKEGNKLALLTTDLNTVTKVELNEVEAEYPNYQKVIDDAKAKEQVAEISFSPERMISLLKAMLKAGVNKDYGKVTLRFSGSIDPIMLSSKDSEGREIEAILMPMRA